MEYKIDKKKRKQTVTYMEYDIEGFTFTPKSSKDYLKVTKVTIINKTMISSLVQERINRKFNQLFKVINAILTNNDDDTDESDINIVLDEIKRVESMIEGKYKNHLKMEEYKLYIDNLYYAKNSLNEKIETFKNNNLEYNKQGRSR